MLMMLFFLYNMKKNYFKNKPSASKKRGLQRVGNGRAARAVRVLNLYRDCYVDPEAQRVVDIAVDPRRHPGLNQKISNYLLGFDASTQGYLAEAVALFVGGHAVTVTCLPAVDALLRRFYREIDALQSNAG